MLSQQFEEHVRAGFSGIWIQSHEHDEAISEIAKLCRSKAEREENPQSWQLLTWDADRGLSMNGAQPDGNGDPLGPIKALSAAPGNDATFILILKNFHRFIDSTEILQAVANCVMEGKATGRHLVILSCLVQIPPELEKHFVVIDHHLPDRDALKRIADGLVPEYGDACLDAAAGLTHYEAESAFALSYIRSGMTDIGAETVWDIKAGALKKAGTLELHRGDEKFSDLGGLDGVKTFCVRSMTQGSDRAKPRGVLLLGVPGAGKSAFAKALGNEVGRPTITMDFGSLMGSLVGESEAKTRQALAIVDRMAPCILFCDEIEKGLSGASGEFNGDSGVSQRMFGTLLTWLNDHESDVFFIGTCLAGSTFVQKEDGTIIRLQDFRDGSLRSLDGRTISGRLLERGNRDALAISTSTGRIVATGDHRFYRADDTGISEVPARYLMAGEMLVGDLVPPHGETIAALRQVESDPRSAFVMQPTEMTADLAYLLGYLIGDGGLAKQRSGSFYRLQWSEEDRDQADRICGMVASIFGKSAKIIDKRPEVNSYYCWLDSRVLCDWLCENFPGLVNVPAPQRVIPESITSAPAHVVAQFLAGMYDAEGTTSAGQIAIGMTSEDAIIKSMMLLQRFDIQASYDYREQESPRNDVHRWTVADKTSLDNFRWLIPIQHRCRQIAVTADRKIIGGSSVRDVPVFRSLIGDMLKSAGVPQTVLPNYRNGSASCSAETAELWLVVLSHYCSGDERLAQLRELWSKKWVRVRSVSEHEPIEVFDVSSSDEPHTFLANGVLVHNCNDIKQLTSVSSGAFTRAERFDGIFFIDLPSEEQRSQIWTMYKELFELLSDESSCDVDDEGWTGAEIKSCCRLAALLGISIEEASEMVVPVAKTASSQIANLRDWADGRALDANRNGIYRHHNNVAKAPVATGRRTLS